MQEDRRALALAAAAMAGLLAAGPARAAEHIKMSAFQGAFVNFPDYVAQDMGLFAKHGLDVEMIYGTGIQVANIMVSGSAEFGAFAVEHGIAVSSKGQDVKLLVLNQTLPPFSIIVRNDVPTPNAGHAYPAMLKDLKGLKIGITTAGASTDISLRFLLRQAGLDPQKDVSIVPLGDTSAQVAGLKNRAADAMLGVEPAPLQAVYGLKIGRNILDLESGEGPETFREYAYNAVFARASYLKDHQQVARNLVAAIVEAEKLINDPAHLDDVAKVAAKNMRGIDPSLLRFYVEKYRSIFRPVATKKAIENVNQVMVGAKQIPQAVPYERLVALDLMPREFTASR